MKLIDLLKKPESQPSGQVVHACELTQDFACARTNLPHSCGIFLRETPPQWLSRRVNGTPQVNGDFHGTRQGCFIATKEVVRQKKDYSLRLLVKPLGSNVLSVQEAWIADKREDSQPRPVTFVKNGRVYDGEHSITSIIDHPSTKNSRA